MGHGDEINHKNRLIRLLQRSLHPLTAAEITQQANSEIIGPEEAYSEQEIASRLGQMPEVYKKDDKYGLRRREDASQAAARIVREATGRD